MISMIKNSDHQLMSLTMELRFLGQLWRLYLISHSFLYGIFLGKDTCIVFGTYFSMAMGSGPKIFAAIRFFIFFFIFFLTSCVLQVNISLWSTPIGKIRTIFTHLDKDRPFFSARKASIDSNKGITWYLSDIS